MTAAAPHILVVDDERDLRDTVCDYLCLHGFRATPADGGSAMWRVLATDPVDLVVLDVRMPEVGGLALAQELRAGHAVGIIMATAAGDLVDRVVGLETGADDYVAKPLDLRELVARIRAVLRRRAVAPAPVPAPVGMCSFGAYRLDAEARRLVDAAGAEVALTRMELDLLAAFAAHPHQVLSRERLLDLAHGKDAEPFDRSIDMRIARIRRKIEPHPARPVVIRTVRGSGYIFTPAAG